MHDPSGFDFTKFVPGFDFLKNLGGTSAADAAAAAPSWVAPTLDPAELDKRIQELKTVHFWLDQNTKAVSATIQALEVQRMTLATLQGMNVSFAEMAESLKIKPEAFSAAPEAPHAKPAAKTAAKTAAKKKRPAQAKPSPSAQAQVDPAQWWGALTDQFQTIANTAMQEMAKNAATHPGAPTSSPAAKSARAKAKSGASSTRKR
jgi:hypothetical protein